VELFLNGKSIGKKDMPRNGHLEWMVNYAPGRLGAVAYKKGKKLEAYVETTEPPYKIVVHPAKATLLADGRDADVINVSVVDRQGREVPDGENLLHFSVAGDARFIGVANGNPSSHEPDQFPGDEWQRHLFNGRCQVILRSALPGTNNRRAASPGATNSVPENIRFTVTGAGLQDAELIIPTGNRQ
jgi:beta-galactosidase